MKKYLSLVGLALLALPQAAFAMESAPVEGGVTRGVIAIAAALAIGMAAVAGTLSQSRAISSGLDAIGRNPSASGKVFIPMLIGLAFIESLVIFSLVIAFFLQGKM